MRRTHQLRSEDMIEENLSLDIAIQRPGNFATSMNGEL
jgi:hypothetical protein